ncbi:MAG: fumarylacetoacetate hydrolase family protein [Thermoplasmata archaeon]
MRVGRARTPDGTFAVFEKNGKLYRLTGEPEKDHGSDPFYNAVWRIIRHDGDTHGAEEVTDYTLDIPIPEVRSIRDFFAFEEHVMNSRKHRGLEVVKEWYEFPAFYYSNTSNLFASGDTVPKPSYTEQLDFEAEFAFVIGKDGRDIAAGEAWDHIMGVTLANDWSARDIQLKEYKIGLGPAKAKDFATSIGPFLLTTDEVLQRMNKSGKIDLPVTIKRNGKVFSMNNLNTIHWNVEALIERASMDSWLRRGDVIMTGTVGHGCLFENGPGEDGWLQAGEEIEISSDAIGKLTNRIS